ncbi:MAG: hypothetical protein Q7V48_00090, partial [Deltaproteobacteria bacterium]|nr:hypothetical protein [Deltaproteobacteria bacterium]
SRIRASPPACLSRIFILWLGHRRQEKKLAEDEWRKNYGKKGGITEQGMRAAASHTASLTAAPEIWKSLFKQTGALQVESFDEMVNTIMAFDQSSLPQGKAGHRILYGMLKKVSELLKIISSKDGNERQ